MKILYVAKHGSGDNDDEGAIAHALAKLGHELVLVNERDTHEVESFQQGCDFCLFHKWPDCDKIHRLVIPRVFWYFDWATGEEPYVLRRMGERRRWIHQVLPDCLCAFATDGDLVAQDKTGKLIHLMQGCDERTLAYRTWKPRAVLRPLVFTGTARWGVRSTHVEGLRRRYKDDFYVVGEGKRRVHGVELHTLLSHTAIAVAPIKPATDRYWSNRVYLTTGLGGFMLHPRCEMLLNHFTEDEVACYRTVEESFSKIDYYLQHPEERERIRFSGHMRTCAEHTYRHRCQELIKQVEDRL